MPRRQPKLTVSTNGTAGPYIIVPTSRAQALRDYLAENGIQTTHDQGQLQSEGKDLEDVLNLGSADPKQVQRLLDAWTG
jgi:hypothetical protein